jgi:hypothetical protein
MTDLLRRVPGARPSLEGIEARDFRAIASMKPAEVLASDEALEAFETAVAQAVMPGEG